MMLLTCYDVSAHGKQVTAFGFTISKIDARDYPARESRVPVPATL